MSKSIKIISNARTHTGNIRKINEDAILSQPEIGIWIVADGMGGHHNGEYASKLLTEEIRIPPHVVGFDDTIHFVKLLLVQKNFQLYHYAKTLGDGIKCGSTVVCLIIRGNKAAVLWVGDSRVYLYTQPSQDFRMLTEDHTVFSVMKKKGQIDDFHPMAEKYKGALARAVGGDEEVDVSENRLVLKGGERFLLCTDGINKEVNDEVLWDIMNENYTPGISCTRIVQQALDNKGRDNMSICVVDVSFV